MRPTLHLGLYGRICEWLFMHRPQRRLRHQYRVAYRSNMVPAGSCGSRSTRPVRQGIIDPTATAVARIALLIVTNRADIPTATGYVERPSSDLSTKITQAMQPQFWELRRRWRQWRHSRQAGRLLRRGPRVGVI